MLDIKEIYSEIVREKFEGFNKYYVRYKGVLFNAFKSVPNRFNKYYVRYKVAVSDTKIGMFL